MALLNTQKNGVNNPPASIGLPPANRIYIGCPAVRSKELTLLIQQASSSTEVIKILRAHQFRRWMDGMDGMNDV